jgi:hypothetical protein
MELFDCIRSKTVWDVFHDLKNVKIAESVTFFLRALLG